ncbi:MAG: hypothetical protein HY319_06635 [Armatimonadetes bacterium]|nr:hypothetical protein [Armatimonadota bacterium]
MDFLCSRLIDSNCRSAISVLSAARIDRDGLREAVWRRVMEGASERNLDESLFNLYNDVRVSETFQLVFPHAGFTAELLDNLEKGLASGVHLDKLGLDGKKAVAALASLVCENVLQPDEAQRLHRIFLPEAYQPSWSEGMGKSVTYLREWVLDQEIEAGLSGRSGDPVEALDEVMLDQFRLLDEAGSAAAGHLIRRYQERIKKLPSAVLSAAAEGFQKRLRPALEKSKDLGELSRDQLAELWLLSCLPNGTAPLCEPLARALSQRPKDVYGLAGSLYYPLQQQCLAQLRERLREPRGDHYRLAGYALGAMNGSWWTREAREAWTQVGAADPMRDPAIELGRRVLGPLLRAESWNSAPDWDWRRLLGKSFALRLVERGGSFEALREPVMAEPVIEAALTEVRRMQTDVSDVGLDTLGIPT